MMSRIVIFCYLVIFTLSCDQRSPVDGDDADGPNLSVSELMIDDDGNLFIDITTLDQLELVEFAVIPIDENSGKFRKIR